MIASSIRLLLLAVALTLCTGVATAQPPRSGEPAFLASEVNEDGVHIQLRVEPAGAKVAQQVTVAVTVRAPEGTSVVLPELQHALAEHDPRLLSIARDIPAESRGERLWTVETQFETLRPGELRIPALEIRYRAAVSEPVSEWEALRTDPMTIEVQSSIASDADPTKFFDIKGEVRLPDDERRPTNRMWLAAAASLAIAAAFAAYVWAGRRRRFDPCKDALRQVARLEEQFDAEQLDYPNTLFALIDVVRHYLQTVTGLPATAQSSDELLDDMDRDPRISASADLRSELQQLLRQADELKFAGGHAADSERPPFDQVRRLLRNATPSTLVTAQETR